MAASNANREAIILTSAKIAQLREVLARAKDDLRQAEGQLDRLLTGETPATLFTGTVLDSENDRSLNQKIVDLLDAAPDRDFSSEDILAAMPQAHLTSIRSALARLAEDKIQRTGRGRYQSRKPMDSPEAA